MFVTNGLKGTVAAGGNVVNQGDTDHAFMAAEIIGDEMYFNAISRTGQTVDAGVHTCRKITPDLESETSRCVRVLPLRAG